MGLYLEEVLHLEKYSQIYIRISQSKVINSLQSLYLGRGALIPGAVLCLIIIICRVSVFVAGTYFSGEAVGVFSEV